MTITPDTKRRFELMGEEKLRRVLLTGPMGEEEARQAEEWLLEQISSKSRRQRRTEIRADTAIAIAIISMIITIADKIWSLLKP